MVQLFSGIFLHPKISLILNYFTVFCYFFHLFLLLSIKRIFYECDMKLFSGHWNKKKVIFLCRSSFYCLLFFCSPHWMKKIFLCAIFFKEMRVLYCGWTLSWGHLWGNVGYFIWMIEIVFAIILNGFWI